MKTFGLRVSEDELKALIDYHLSMHGKDRDYRDHDYDIERSQRIHDLTKRLNKETPEIENDPRPEEPKQSSSAWD